MIGLEINACKSPQGNQASAPTSLVTLLCLLAASFDCSERSFPRSKQQLSWLIDVNGLLGKIPRTERSDL
jgi:hypothetical protein